MREVQLSAESLSRLADLLSPERGARLREVAQWGARLLDGRTVWHVNATATGGGVAEMLQALLSYTLDAGVDTRWLVLHGSPEFFTLTKRIHNLLHGSVGDGGPLGEEQRPAYEAALHTDADDLVAQVREGDVVVLHDPQTAGMVAPVRAAGAHVVWRCHVGKDETDERTDRAWAFLRPYVEQADAVVFSRQAYVPDWVRPDVVRLIPPSIDPYSAKNVDLTPEDAAAVLRRAGLVDLPEPDDGSVAFTRRDGTSGQVRELRGLIHGAQVVPGEARVVLQVSRWDHLKDMAGVLRGFCDALGSMPDDVHLMLVGPDVLGVSDDPEGAAVFEECLAVWEEPRRGRPCTSPPVQPADGRRRRERPHRQRAAASRLRRGAEEPGGGVRPHRHRADVEGPARARLAGGRHPGPDRRRGVGGPARRRRGPASLRRAARGAARGPRAGRAPRRRGAGAGP